MISTSKPTIERCAPNVVARFERKEQKRMENNNDTVPDKVEIRHPRNPFPGGASQVWATIGMDEIQVFFYNPKDVSFTKEELKGLTVQEMRELRREKLKALP